MNGLSYGNFLLELSEKRAAIFVIGRVETDDLFHDASGDSVTGGHVIGCLQLDVVRGSGYRDLVQGGAPGTGDDSCTGAVDSETLCSQCGLNSISCLSVGTNLWQVTQLRTLCAGFGLAASLSSALREIPSDLPHVAHIVLSEEVEQ